MTRRDRLTILGVVLAFCVFCVLWSYAASGWTVMADTAVVSDAP